MIKNRWNVRWTELPSLYRDAWHKFPFQNAEDAQEFVNLASSRVVNLASRAPDGIDKSVVNAWNNAMFEELVSNYFS